MLTELKRVVDLLNDESQVSEIPNPPPKSRPVLRVIQGGLSIS
jgi:hypothetical protein